MTHATIAAAQLHADELARQIAERGFRNAAAEITVPSDAQGRIRVEGSYGEKWDDRHYRTVFFDAAAPATFEAAVAEARATVTDWQTPEQMRRAKLLQLIADVKTEAEHFGLATEEIVNPLTVLAEQLASNALEHKVAAE